MRHALVVALVAAIFATPALAQTPTPGSFTPSASGTQVMLQSGTIPQNHVPIASATAGQFSDGGVLPTGTTAPPPVQLTGTTTLTATQTVPGAIFWYSGTSAATVTLPAPAAGLRAFFEVDALGTVLSITSANGNFVNLPGGGATINLSQPFISTALVWADGAAWHVGSVF